ncbi:class I SAM-dependent methyltransferase [Aureisphaera galaxeae]|uniref:class I SAM-dependent methyltransferase n=1 Tax=Aureisphaera galaxeae TaxID=1538023 RepID=UPI00234FD623|nr:class I SAM-dependent methyltransferase [Aureisphaera galaxeae]MDC8003958.1 class I SAM-dependent methyltransferase [Aureisphaera galaxeae]
MKRIAPTLYFIVIVLLPILSVAQEDYVLREGDPDGIGKWYMQREIARVMDASAMDWLERPERSREENTALLMMNLRIRPDDTIADIGAGSGYHVFRMAPRATNGHVYAVDIQDEMLQAIKEKQENGDVTNVSTVKGTEKSVNLPENSVDKILMVDVYHEFSFPKEMMASIQKALRPNGKIYLIEYREEDPYVPIKKLHKMSEEQAVAEMEAAGFQLLRNINNLPWQHCMIFVKERF